MSGITLESVKKLRELTLAGIADCKKALIESNGNFEAAKDWLKQKGLSIANKKLNRVAAEGLVVINNNGKKATIVEVNSETDFVAKNQDFINFILQVSKVSIDCNSLDELKDADYGNGNTVESELLNLISKVRENLVIRKLEIISACTGSKLYSYVHSKIVDNIGRIAVVINLKGEGDLTALGKGIAMHIAGFNPLALSSNDLDITLIEKEKALISEQLKNITGKSEEVLKKMLDGKMKKFFKEVCLLEQNYLLDDKKTVGQVLKEHNAELISYIHVALGEDIEKSTVNFAEEVNKIISG